MTSAAESKSRSTSYIRWSGGLVVLVVLLVFLPPFKVVSLDENGAIPRESEEEVFDTVAYASEFWSESLANNFDKAISVQELVSAVASDPLEARKQFGVRQGEGAIYYFASGEAEVVAVKGRRATLKVGDKEVNLLIAPPVFGNTIRDGTGLLDLNALPGLEEFNAVSAALNQKVEAEVMPGLKDSVVVGSRVSFVGCSKAPETLKEGPILEFTPLRVEVTQ